jgi:hypothetical protein
VEGIERAAKGGGRQVTVESEGPAVAKHLRDELVSTGYSVRLENVAGKRPRDAKSYNVTVAW